MITVPSPLAWVAAAASLPVSLLVPLLPRGRSHDSGSPLLHFVPAPASASPSHPPRKQPPRPSAALPCLPRPPALPSPPAAVCSAPGPGQGQPALTRWALTCPRTCIVLPAALPPQPPAALRATEAGARHAVGYPAPHVPGTKPVEEEITCLIVTHRNFYKGKRYHHCY